MKKKIFTDIFLNLIASAIPIALLQLCILPLISRYLSADEYGFVITSLSYLNVIPAAMGVALNNTRLLNNVGSRKKSDYNALLLVLVLCNLFALCLFLGIYADKISLIDMGLNVILSLVIILYEYHVVAFRLNINYGYIVITNVFMGIGYALGYVGFRIFGYWQCVYILGYICALLFVFRKSTLWKESFKVTEKFRETTKETVLLMLSGVFGRITTYADKLLIFPMLGGTMVAVYYAASVFSKIVSLVIAPISNVILTYTAKITKKNNRLFWTTLFSCTVVGSIGYFICILCSRPILHILYPQYVDEAMKYIYITTGTTVTHAIASVINPFLLKFLGAKWQVRINFWIAVVYVVLCICMISVAGLYGMCFGALFTNVFKLFFMCLIYVKLTGKASTVEKVNV